MRKLSRGIIATGAAVLIAGCATIAPPSAVEVTRFHDAAGLEAIGERTVYVANAPGLEEGSLELTAFKRAVAAELTELGYVETPRRDAAYTAQVSIDRFAVGQDLPKRGPVSVGVGGRTGSYGSGVGLGIGINLGGNKSRERVGTELGVMLKSRATGATVWEGRANWDVAKESELVAPAANAPVIADALFAEFPGGNGETIKIEVSE